MIDPFRRQFYEAMIVIAPGQHNKILSYLHIRMYKILVLFLSISLSSAYAQKVDTLKVHENDTSAFNLNMYWIQRPCQKPHWETNYELKNPQDSTYYFIYNEKGQLIKEGLYTENYLIDGEPYKGFHTSKHYYYKINGKLSRVDYRVDERNIKIEYYKRGKIKEVREMR